jgi:chemotaxis protein CheX
MEEYLQPFIDVCVNTFQAFCKTHVTVGRIFIEERDKYENLWDVSGIIGLTGDAKGALALSLKEDTALNITQIITGEKPSSMDINVTDVVGEIINIIAGNVKKDLQEMFRLTISTPSIVKGRLHQLVWPIESTRVICVPFTIFNTQKFCLSVVIEPNNRGSREL